MLYISLNKVFLEYIILCISSGSRVRSSKKMSPINKMFNAQAPAIMLLAAAVPQDQVAAPLRWLWREPAAAASRKTLVWPLSLRAAPLRWLWREPAAAALCKIPAGAVERMLRYNISCQC